MGLLSDLFKLFADAFEGDALLGGQNAKRTLCCGVKMWDLWSHAPACPQTIKANGQYSLWRHENPDAPLSDTPNFVPPKGYRDGLCDQCGYPTGHYGIYTVGEPCPYCGYVERRTPKPAPKRK